MLNNMESLEIENTYSKRFNIVLCEIFNEKTNGSFYNFHSPLLCGHYLNLYRFNWKLVDEEDGINIVDLNYVNEIASLFHKNNKSIKRNKIKYYHYITKHSIIRNYKNMIENKNYIKPEIAECFYLEGGECISIIKTFWIKWIQRCWKRVLKERKTILLKRLSYSCILYREQKGKWPTSCNSFPGLYGLLSKKER